MDKNIKKEEEITEVEQAEQDQQLYRTISLKEKTVFYTEEKDGFEATVKYKLPSLKQKETASMMYSKMYNKLMQDGDFLTSKQLLDQAKKRGVWSDNDELRLVTVDQEIMETKELVKEESSKKKQETLQVKLANLRDEKFRIALRLGQITQTSLDNIAENARNEYMMLNCIFSVDEEGKESPFFKSLEELNNETDLAKIEKLLLDARSFWTGEGLSDFLHFDD